MSALAEDTRPKYMIAVESAKSQFDAVDTGLIYDKEKVFAVNALIKSSYSRDIASNNPASVKSAMYNLASIGLTLNPANGYAYLVPRDKAIMLDISYKGLIKIATDTGSIMWARAEVVHATDEFVYCGPAAAPTHTANPFKDRGAIVGVYCIAKTRDGDILTEVMSLEELHKIRDKSMAYAKSNSGPWVDWFSEMCRKSVIKRASKTWPYSERADKIFHAIDLANEAEGGYLLDAPKGGQPLSGVWEAQSPDSQADIIKVAANIQEYFDQQDMTGLLDYLDSKAYDADTESALWTQLNSKVRSAIKAETAKRKAA